MAVNKFTKTSPSLQAVSGTVLLFHQINHGMSTQNLQSY